MALSLPSHGQHDWDTQLNSLLSDHEDRISANDSALVNKETPAGAQAKADAALAAAQATLEPLTVNGKRAVRKDEFVFNVRDYGAVGNGVTDDGTAFNNAIVAASQAGSFAPSVVFAPWTSTGYATSGLILKNGVTLRGEGMVKLLRVGSASAVYINTTGQTDVAIEGFTIDDTNNLTTSSVVRCSTGTTRWAIRRCKLQNISTTSVQAVTVDTSTSQVIVEDNWFDNCNNNVKLNTNPSRVNVRRNRFTNWQERCIYVLGTATQSSTDVTIEHNLITDMKAGGSVRQPIVFEGNDAMPHLRARVLYNTVIGPNKAYLAADPGTADQISLHRVKGFLVQGNTSYYGGDVGITIALQCSHGRVIGNDCQFNDTVGIALGSSATTTLKKIAATGNTLHNNGQNRNGDRSDVARVGFYCYGLSDSSISGNVLGDDQGTATQQHGTYRRNCNNVRFSANIYAGHALANDSTDVGNTNIVDDSFTSHAVVRALCVAGVWEARPTTSTDVSCIYISPALSDGAPPDFIDGKDVLFQPTS